MFSIDIEINMQSITYNRGLIRNSNVLIRKYEC